MEFQRVRLNVVEEINGASVYIKARTASLRINDINKIKPGIYTEVIYHLAKMPRASVLSVAINNGGKSHFLGHSPSPLLPSAHYLAREKTRAPKRKKLARLIKKRV